MKRIYAMLLGSLVLGATVFAVDDDLTLEEREKRLDETKYITFSNGARLKVEYTKGARLTKESSAFMLHTDADGRQVVYPVDMDYYTKKFGGDEVEDSSQKYLVEAARRTKNTYGFSVLRDMYFGEDDELLPTYKMFISKCRAVLAAEKSGELTEIELDYKARNIVEWILYDTDGKVTTEMVRNVKVYVKRAIAAKKKEEDRIEAAKVAAREKNAKVGTSTIVK